MGKTEYIFNIKNKAFSKKQLKKLGILELVNQIGVKDYNYFNFIPFERLLYLADYRNDIKRSLKKLDFTIITFSSINKEESIDVTDLNGENNVGNNNSEKIDDKAYKIKHDISSMYGVFAKKILFFGFEYTIKQTSSFFQKKLRNHLNLI